MTDAEIESASKLNQSKQQLQNLFDILGLDSIVIVDDVYSAKASKETITANCIAIVNAGNANLLTKIAGMEAFAYDDDEVWQKQLSSMLDKEAELNEIALKVADFVDGSDDRESEKSLVLQSWFDGLKVSPHILSLDDWKQQKKDLISKHESTLFLFDRDMTNNGGSENEGIRIAVELLKSSQVTYCGIVSNTFNNVDELEALEAICKENGLDRHKDSFGILPKSKLQTDLSPFVHTIKRWAISPTCSNIKKRVNDLVGKSFDNAKNKLDELTIYEFEQCVFQSSMEEGVWELDTLIKIFALLQSHEYRQLSHSDQQLSTMASEVRKVVSCARNLPIESPTDRVAAIKRLELYDEPTHINQIFKPLEVGDVFQKVGSNKKKVLIGQPCDLMLRSNGKRGGTKLAALAELTERATAGNGCFELPFFLEDNQSAWIKFARYELVPLDILDLACFRKDGKTVLAENDELPENLTPSLAAAFQRRLACTKSCHEKYRKFGTREGICQQEKKILIGGITELSGDFVKPSFDLKTNSIDFGLQRIRRVKPPYCDAILRKFSSFISREAFDHDLTQTLKM